METVGVHNEWRAILEVCDSDKAMVTKHGSIVKAVQRHMNNLEGI